MKKLIIISIASCSLFAQGLYDDFDIPTFEYRNLSVSGEDLFSSHSEGGESTTDMNIGADYNFMGQSPEFTWSYGLDFDYNSDGDAGADGNGTSDWDVNLPFSVNKYLGDSHGLYGFASGNFDMDGGDQAEGNDDTSDLNLFLGAGFGRIVSAKPVAQAAAMASELGGLSNSAILEMASIISKYESGWYANQHKDNADLEYYNDLAAAAGDSGSAMKLMQIQESGLYQITDRSIGWYVKGGLWNNYMRAEGDDDKGELRVWAGYALPLDMDKQVTAWLNYNKGMNDGDNAYMTLGANCSIDHSYTWSTTAGLTYLSLLPAEGEGANLMGLTVSSTRVITNKLTGTASFSYSKDSEVDDAVTDMNVSFSYWVF